MAAEGEAPFRGAPGAGARQWGRDRLAAEGRRCGPRLNWQDSVNGAATVWPRKVVEG